MIGICFGQTFIRVASDNIFRVTEKPDETMTIRLVFRESVPLEDRANMSVVLTSDYCPQINITNQTKYSDTDKEAVEFIYLARSITCFSFYNISFVDNNGNSIPTGYKIYIYNKDFRLKNPKERFFLVDDSPNPDNVTAIFDLEDVQPLDSINKISCVSSTNTADTIDNVAFRILTTTKTILEVKMTPTPEQTTYNCDIFPINSPNSQQDFQRFRVHFHEYILETEAIYFEKRGPDTDVLDNRNISFKIKFKDDYDPLSNNLLMKDFNNAEVNFVLKGCEDKVCEFLISSAGEVLQPGKYSLFFKVMQERELFYILYEKKNLRNAIIGHSMNQ